MSRDGVSSRMRFCGRDAKLCDNRGRPRRFIPKWSAHRAREVVEANPFGRAGRCDVHGSILCARCMRPRPRGDTLLVVVSARRIRRVRMWGSGACGARSWARRVRPRARRAVCNAMCSARGIFGVCGRWGVWGWGENGSGGWRKEMLPFNKSRGHVGGSSRMQGCCGCPQPRHRLGRAPRDCAGQTRKCVGRLTVGVGAGDCHDVLRRCLEPRANSLT